MFFTLGKSFVLSSRYNPPHWIKAVIRASLRSSFPGWAKPGFSASHGTLWAPGPGASRWPSALLTPVCLYPYRTWKPQVRCRTPYAVLQAPNREEKIAFLDLLSVLLPSFWLFLFNAEIHCSLVLNLSTRAHGSLPVELLSSWLASSLCHDAGYSCMQGFAFAELWEISASSFLQSVSPPKWQLSGVLMTSVLFGIICKIADWSPCFSPVVNINVKRNWSQYQPLSNTMSNKPPAVLLTSYYYSLCLTTRTDTHWTFTQPLWSICHQCGYKSIMGHLAKSLLNLHPLLFSCPLIVECNRVCHVWFPSRKSVLVDPKHPSVLHRAGTCFKEDMPYCLPRTGVRLACHFPSFSFLLSLKMHDEICLLQVIKSLPSHRDLSKS